MAKGAGWIIAGRMCSRVLGIVNTIILVRLLSPADFGLVALATSLAVSLEALVSVGVNDALIRETEPDRALYDTGFTMNLLRCSFVSLAILACAVPAAQFFGDPRLTPLLLVVAGMILISGFSNIGVVEFRRNLSFDKEFVIGMVPRIVGILTSIVCAVIFANYWALVAGLVSMRGLALILTYWMHPYRPGITLRAWRRIIVFSFWTWLSSIIGMMKERIDALVIGRVLGPGPVGIYAIGLEIGTLASTELLEPLATAMFSGFAAGRREGADNGQGFFKAISVTLMLTLPIGIGISLVAAPVINLLFGTRWSEAILLVQVFALLGVTRLIPYFSSVLLSAHGMLHTQFRISAIGLFVRVVVMLALIGPLGLIGALISATACAMVEEVLYLVVTFHVFKLRTIDLLRTTWRSFLAATVMALVVYAEGIGWAPASHETVPLLVDQGIAVSSGAATYCGVVLAIWWVCGRPDGAETMLLSIIKDTWRHMASNPRGRRA